jgi:hypothetical protein
LQDRAFDEAVTKFGEALKHRPDYMSVERVRKLQLFHACALYEAGKQHYTNGDWGDARKRFESAKKTEALPDELEKKILDHIKDCKQRIKELRKKATLEEGKTEEVNFNEDNDGVKQAVALYKSAKTAL